MDTRCPICGDVCGSYGARIFHTIKHSQPFTGGTDWGRINGVPDTSKVYDVWADIGLIDSNNWGNLPTWVLVYEVKFLPDGSWESNYGRRGTIKDIKYIKETHLWTKSLSN